MKKDRIIEQMGDQNYKTICEGKYEFNQIYKKLMKYHPDPILNEIEMD